MQHLVEGDRHGATYDPKRDRRRLNGQAKRVFDFMLDGRWRTLREIADGAHCPEASASARLRDLRRQEFGAFTVEHENVGGGLWRYRLIVPVEMRQMEMF